MRINELQFNFLFPGGASGSGSADGACLVDDLECHEMHDRLGMEAIKSLHEQLDDDDNGNIDLTESDDVSDIFICLSIFIVCVFSQHLVSHNFIRYIFFSFFAKSSNTILDMRNVTKPSITMTIHKSQLKSCGKHGSGQR